jgi:hypothetical protein
MASSCASISYLSCCVEHYIGRSLQAAVKPGVAAENITDAAPAASPHTAFNGGEPPALLGPPRTVWLYDVMPAAESIMLTIISFTAELTVWVEFCVTSVFGPNDPTPV